MLDLDSIIIDAEKSLKQQIKSRIETDLSDSLGFFDKNNIQILKDELHNTGKKSIVIDRVRNAIVKYLVEEYTPDKDIIRMYLDDTLYNLLDDIKDETRYQMYKLLTEKMNQEIHTQISTNEEYSKIIRMKELNKLTKNIRATIKNKHHIV